MLRVLLSAAALGVVSCSAEDALLLPLPDHPGARAAILAVTDASGMTLLAADLDGGRPLALERPGTALDLSFELLLLDAPLASVGLSEGPVRAAAAGSAGYLLPSAAAIYTAEVHAGLAGAWAAAARPSPALAEFRATSGSASLCRPLGVTRIPLDSSVDYAFALDPEGRRVLIGKKRRAWVLEGAALREVVFTGLRDFEPRAAGARPGADPFFASEDGRLAHGTLDGTVLELRLATTATIAPQPRFVDAGLREAGFEFFTLSRSGILSHVSPEGSAHLQVFAPLEVEASFGGLARLKSGSAVAGLSSEAYVYFTGDVPRSRRLSSAPTAIASFPSLGILLADQLGRVLIERPSEFEPYFDPGTVRELTALAPLGEDGVLYASSTGQLGYYRAASGPCLDPALRAGAQGRFIVRREASRDWVVTGNELDGSGGVALVTLDGT